MATQDVHQTVEHQQEASPGSVGWRGRIEEQYLKIKTHAEEYPYVWGSYILVYGGFGLWLTYRWRRLRNTEDRVRVLQERLRKLVEAEQPTTNSTQPPNPALSTKNVVPPSDEKGTN
ncbi:hypothetical protein F511_13470 [Dorcoceras hygrometricum]|uniref:Transmembrane protein n=1 Tax=Dorcoceras hygrometricum TaxID=472368 RepID=A0A2Z7AKC9_9LAMI|nr:hypothetical protein F511_13470 [Dorcoceras hygrometricum]